jgi:hypothetical protein
MEKPPKEQLSKEPLPEKSVTGFVEVVLIAAHEHAGELKQVGDIILVNQRQHEFLRAQGKIE